MVQILARDSHKLFPSGRIERLAYSEDFMTEEQVEIITKALSHYQNALFIIEGDGDNTLKKELYYAVEALEIATGEKFDYD